MVAAVMLTLQKYHHTGLVSKNGQKNPLLALGHAQTKHAWKAAATIPVGILRPRQLISLQNTYGHLM